MQNRRLIRPSLAQYRQPGPGAPSGAVRPRAPHAGGLQPERIPAPPESTNAEAFYYVKQMTSNTPIVAVLDGDETLEGLIIWYDRDSIHLRRADGSRVLLYKKAVRYLYKLEEVDPAGATDYSGSGLDS